MEFERRAVAFVDVLGFASFVERAAEREVEREKLKKLVKLLESVVPDQDGKVDFSTPKSLIPRHNYISDSIILSAPITSSERPNYCGLSAVIVRVIQISHTLLNEGYLIRGGVSVGPVWHTESNIVGRAYQEACHKEAETDVPRVELTRDARDEWAKKTSGSNTMCLEYMGRLMVNVLHDYYIPNRSHGSAEKTFQKYLQIVDANLENTTLHEKARYKWWWFKNYLESELSRNPYIVHPVANP